jgi:hypothetical protein
LIIGAGVAIAMLIIKLIERDCPMDRFRNAIKNIAEAGGVFAFLCSAAVLVFAAGVMLLGLVVVSLVLSPAWGPAAIVFMWGLPKWQEASRISKLEKEVDNEAQPT